MSNEITLYCPSCGGRTKFSPETESWVCEYCGNEHVFNLQRPIRTPETGRSRRDPTEKVEPEPATRLRPLRPQPRDVKFTKDGNSLKFSWQWYSCQYIFLAFFCIAWDSFLCFWYGMAISDQGTPWIMIVFPIFHVAVGVGLTYYTLAGFINRSTVRVDRDSFSVRHGPLPWYGSLDIPISDLQQLYTQEKRGSSDSATTYQLNAVLKNGRKLKLLPNLDSPDVGFFIEQQIENWLNIEDQTVRGEMPRWS